MLSHIAAYEFSRDEADVVIEWPTWLKCSDTCVVVLRFW